MMTAHMIMMIYDILRIMELAYTSQVFFCIIERLKWVVSEMKSLKLNHQPDWKKISNNGLANSIVTCRYLSLFKKLV